MAGTVNLKTYKYKLKGTMEQIQATGFIPGTPQYEPTLPCIRTEIDYEKRIIIFYDHKDVHEIIRSLLWARLIEMFYERPEQVFNPTQLKIINELDMTPVYQEQTKEFMGYRKQYGLNGGSYLFVDPDVNKCYGSQYYTDINLFLPGYDECRKDYLKLKKSGLFV